MNKEQQRRQALAQRQFAFTDCAELNSVYGANGILGLHLDMKAGSSIESLREYLNQIAYRLDDDTLPTDLVMYFPVKEVN